MVSAYFKQDTKVFTMTILRLVNETFDSTSGLQSSDVRHFEQKLMFSG